MAPQELGTVRQAAAAAAVVDVLEAPERIALVAAALVVIMVVVVLAQGRVLARVLIAWVEAAQFA